MFGAADAQIQAYQEEKKQKQEYIQTYVVGYGYSIEDFN